MDSTISSEVIEIYTAMISLWRAFLFISCTWCSASIIIDIVKIYTFKDDKKEIFRSLFDILKTLIYFIPLGVMINISTAISNDSINLDLLFAIGIIITVILSLIISMTYKKCNKEILIENDNNNEKENELN